MDSVYGIQVYPKSAAKDLFRKLLVASRIVTQGSVVPPNQTPQMTSNEIPSSLYERVASAYASCGEFNLKSNDYSGNRVSGYKVERSYDLGREPVEIVRLSENEYLVIDQPRNFKDYFACGGSNAWGRDGAATAEKLRKFYASHHLHVKADGTMTLELQTWTGGRFHRDAEKSQKQLAKYVKAHLARKTPLPHLNAIILA